MLPSPKLCEMPRLVARVVAAIDDAAMTRPSAGGFALVEHVWHLVELEVEAFQVRIGWHKGHVVALLCHCERRMSR